MTTITEVAYPLFALAVILSPDWRDALGRITHFAYCGYDDQRDVKVRLVAGRLANPYPKD